MQVSYTAVTAACVYDDNTPADTVYSKSSLLNHFHISKFPSFDAGKDSIFKLYTNRNGMESVACVCDDNTPADTV